VYETEEPLTEKESLIYLAKVGVEGSNPFARSNFLVIKKANGPVLRGRFHIA